MSEKTQPRAKRGPNDPGRRDRIAQAALEIAYENGLGAVSHRSVATGAGVPLGSTTYHFVNLDSLLVAAMEKGMARHATVYEEWSATLSRSSDFPATLADLAITSIQANQRELKVEIELIVASLRRPALRAVSEPWSNLMSSMLGRHVDEETAGVLALILKGVLAELPSKGVPERDRLTKILRRAMEDSFDPQTARADTGTPILA